jgi:hypothetical protein
MPRGYRNQVALDICSGVNSGAPQQEAGDLFVSDIRFSPQHDNAGINPDAFVPSLAIFP